MANIYYQIIDITDFGPYVTKVVLAMPEIVRKDEITADTFNVFVEIVNRNGKLIRQPKSMNDRNTLVPCCGYRSVTDAYPSATDGRKTDQSSYVTLELAYGPICRLSSALAADFSDINAHESYTVHLYRIVQTKDIGRDENRLSGLVFDQCAGTFNPKKDRFLTGVSSYRELSLRYGYYVPQRPGKEKPLIIFLHGAGEGGTDTAIAWSGNKVTCFTDEYAQDIFEGAYVLVPQCPTMWLDDGSHTYGTSGRSMYVKALKALIDEFIENNPGIDHNRIYLGGDSNGGFMTMRMLMDYPDFFAAGFPICEAMIDTAISDEDIARLKDIPIWFTHAKNDPVVKPEDYVLPTYQRLIKAGGKNIHFTFWDRIVDLHEGFRDESGQPYEYLGHFAWIPVFNDDCRLDYDGKPVVANGKDVTLFQWLALQKKHIS